jgi:cell division transport system permease protein
MIRHVARALADIRANRFVNLVSAITVALVAAIVGAAILLVLNTQGVLEGWQRETRLMVYLKPGAAAAAERLQRSLAAIDGVRTCRFVPREAALQELRERMPGSPSLFENLEDNPLPDAFEVGLGPAADGWAQAAAVASRIAALSEVDGVEYGRQWVDLLQAGLSVVQAAGAVVVALFAFAAVAIVGGTTRLVVYSRRDEVEILRLIGAAERFINAPFYIGGALQGLFGGAIGLGVLALVFDALAGRLGAEALPMLPPVRFFAWQEAAALLAASVLTGWLGAWAALRPPLRS